MNKSDEYSLEARREWIKTLDTLKENNHRLKEWVETNDREFTTIIRAIRALLENNGGPTSTLEGNDTHVLVRREDFDALEKIVKRLELVPRKTFGDLPPDSGLAGSCNPSHRG